MTKYIFRMDDISWDMNYENFYRIRDLFIKYGVKPIIGVIPHNEDEKLKSQVGQYHLSEEEFWPMVKDLQDNHGWAIALHGYNHVYVTDNGGIFGYYARSEFAGLPYQEQFCKIQKGKETLEHHGLSIDAFMAPAHALDWVTVEALLDNGIEVITDGCSPYPYHEHGMLFVPEIWPWPNRMSTGVDTVALHINEWDEQNFRALEQFIATHRDQMTSFQETVAEYGQKDKISPWKRVAFAKKIATYRAVKAKVTEIKSALRG